VDDPAPDPAPADPPGVRRVRVDRGEVRLVREEPLVIEVGAEAVLTMRTPGDDEDLALGFLLAEGIVRAADDVLRVEVTPRTAQRSPYPVDVARVVLRPGREPGPVERERLTRAHAIRASCGLCGRASPEGLVDGIAPLAPGAPRVSLRRLAAWAEGLRAVQPVFRATGGSHAAAVIDVVTGERWVVREDVGRHNALDKALGRCAREGRPLARAAVILSGRGGFELVLKALRLGVPIVGSVSAPSSLAVELALERGLTLVGFLRGEGGTVYADDGRLQDESDADEAAAAEPGAAPPDDSGPDGEEPPSGRRASMPS
jgi:FdhD protein